MLILSRKLGERFQIGPDVTITIVKVDRNTVRIGIDAPRGTPIQREELTRALTAATTAPSSTLQHESTETHPLPAACLL